MKESEIKSNINLIMACPLFKGMVQEEIIDILANDGCLSTSTLIRAEEGTCLDVRMMYVILKGQVLIEKEASDGRIVRMSKASVPAAINVAAPLAETGFSSLCVSKEATLIGIDAIAVKEAINAGGRFALNYASFLTDRIAFLNHKITSLSGYSALSRLELYIEENTEDDKVIIPENLTAFAESLGVGRASLYRAFDTLEESGRIRRKGRELFILEAQ